MAKTITSPDDTKKQRKKLAKREAKTMLKLDEARKGVQKAEGRVVKAQAQLEASRTVVHDLEAALAEMSASQRHGRAQGSGEEGGSQNNTGVYDSTPAPTDQVVASLPPAEGRTDISAEHQQAEEITQRASTQPSGSRVHSTHRTTPASTEEASGTGGPERATTKGPSHHRTTSTPTEQKEGAPVMENPSDMPAPAEPETAWPPVETRKEVLHAAEEAQAGSDDGQQQKSTRNTSRRRRGQTHTEG